MAFRRVILDRLNVYISPGRRAFTVTQAVVM